MGTITKIIAVVYILVALYLLNMPFNIIPVDLFGDKGNWIIFFGGILVLIQGIRFFFKRLKKGFESYTP